MSNEPTILEAIDPDLAGNLVSRRGLFSAARLRLGAVASAPAILAVASTTAFGQGKLPKQIVDTLNFALTLEYLEDAFYKAGLDAGGLIPGKYRDVFETISDHEDAHVKFLKGALGSAAVKKPEFDLTAGGKYGDALSNFATYATLAETFEDLGVRAYKGQVGNLIESNEILTAALRIHSVEARHAAEIRAVNSHLPWKGAFDEPLSKAKVLAAAKPFIVG